jgi:hypothetical protein
MSSSEQKEDAHFARLAVLKAQIEQEFGGDREPPPAQREARLIAQLAEVQTLIADLTQTRDEIGEQLQGSASGLLANAAYSTSAGLGNNRNDQ